MSLLLILIILLVVLGGGGFYAGGPRVGGGLAGLILLILLIMALTGDCSALPLPLNSPTNVMLGPPTAGVPAPHPRKPPTSALSRRCSIR